MKVNYKVTIDAPETHMVKVSLKGEIDGRTHLTFFMPSWSPGSYLMREYSRNVRTFKAETELGETLHFDQIKKGHWRVDFDKLPKKGKAFQIHYEVYCHELSVRTNHVDLSHAFLHGPALFLGIEEEQMVKPEVQFVFPPLWTGISTGLRDISQKREEFHYSAKDYDELLDSPVEIGCHETDGFKVGGKNHFLAFYGNPLPHGRDLKGDMKRIVEHIANVMKDIPYEDYTFITHFVPNLYGGLEHLNSTALHFDGTKLADPKAYRNWLALVSHEYFHTWNVKRIRPRELGPFNYTEEAYSKLLWLAEGLTSFVDELFVYQTGLITLDDYLDMQKENLNRYLSIPGRRFHSLEDSSFNAWIKLYRPDENSNNTSISYYLKGGIAFWCLNVLLIENGKSINDLLDLLWDSYKKRPDVGLESDEVFKMVEDLAGKEVKEKFKTMIQTTEELDLESYFKRAALKIEWEDKNEPWLGATPKFDGERVFINTIELDSPAYKAGLNAGDELIAINDLRITKATHDELNKRLLVDKDYIFTVSRLNKLEKLHVVTGKSPRKVAKITTEDEKKTNKFLGV